MVNAKKIASSFAAFALVLCSILSMFTPVSAATFSSGTQTRTITVTTKANYLIPGSESITLSQTKGTCQKQNGKTSKVYGEWDIVARATDGSHVVRESLTGGSVKIKLKPNKTYKITVTWDTQTANLRVMTKGNFIAYPTWKVKSTWKVRNYY